MKNLVSKNPVQRFKEGRKIVKAGEGLKAIQNSIYNSIYGTLWGLRHPIENTKRLFSNQNSVDQDKFAEKYLNEVSSNYDDNGRLIKKKKKSNSGFLGDDVEKAPAGLIVKGGSNRRKGITLSGVTNRVLSKYSGVDLQGKTVGEWQNILKDYYAPGTKKKYMEDGIWGDATNAAYEAYLQKQKEKETLEHPTLENVAKIGSIIPTYTPPTEVPSIQKIEQPSYNRAGVRDFLRQKKLNPYSFSGAQRRALRMVLNGTADDNDKLLVKGMGIFKKGGQLPSRNVVERFKQRNFR